jgi:Carboxypeptidase regulatory-like domain
MQRGRSWVVAALSVSALAGAPTLDAQTRRSTLSVGVAEAATGAPIAGAEVLLPELKLIARTDALGHVAIPGIPEGTHRVRVRLIGFAPGDVQLQFRGDTTGAVFRLERSAVPLSRVDVTEDAVPARLKDFEMRRKQGIGRFLTEAELQRDYNRAFTDVASVRFPGLAIKTDEFGKPHIASTRSNCGGASGGADNPRGHGAAAANTKIIQQPKASGGGGEDGGGSSMSGSCESTRPCFVQVYLDDINLGEADDGLVQTWDLSGAEYYTGASMPARYRTSGSACGVLLLWSKWR